MKRIIYSAAMLLALLSTACGGGNKEASELPQIDELHYVGFAR